MWILTACMEDRASARYHCSSRLFLLLQSRQGYQEWAPNVSGPTPCALWSVGPSNLRLASRLLTSPRPSQAFPTPNPWEGKRLLQNLYAGQEATVEPHMEQQTGSKLGKESVKSVCCHPVYLTFMQSTSCKVLGWMKHKLESRVLGDI